jgi:hypothetical protein
MSVRILHHVAQTVAEPGNHGHSVVVSLLAHQSSDRIECVEQEVRLDLSAKCVELRLGELLVEASGFSLLKSQALS